MMNEDNLALARIKDLTDDGLFDLSKMINCGNALVTGSGYIGEVKYYFYSQNPEYTDVINGDEYRKDLFSVFEAAMKEKVAIIGIFDDLNDFDNGTFDELYSEILDRKASLLHYAIIYGECNGPMVKIANTADVIFMRANGGSFQFDENLAQPHNGEECAIKGVIDYTGNKSMLNPMIKGTLNLLSKINDDKSVAINFEKELVINNKMIEDTSLLFLNIADNYKFVELKKTYCPELVTGLITVNDETYAVYGFSKKRITVNGITEYSEKLSAEALCKYIEFMKFCDKFNLSVITNRGTVEIIDNSKNIESLHRNTYLFDKIANMELQQAILNDDDNIVSVDFNNKDSLK